MNYLVGSLLVIVEIVAIIYGDKTVQKEGGIVLKAFSHRSPISNFLIKWAIGLLCIWFGLGFLFGGIQL